MTIILSSAWLPHRPSKAALISPAGSRPHWLPGAVIAPIFSFGIIA